MHELLIKINDAVQKRQQAELVPSIEAAIEAGLNPKAIIDDGLIAAMDVVGSEFSDGIIFVPEMLVSAMLMKQGLKLIKPLIAGGSDEKKGKVLIGTVKGDLHDIGKNIVVMLLEGAGFEVVDLGVDLSVDQVVKKVAELKPQIVGLSALLTTTMPEMQKTIAALTESGFRDQVKVMVGGAPLNQAFADSIGADGYAKDAAEAVSLARRMVSA
ncbi:MAG: corrinoid protein [Deltaproteobacteria bacterium]|nr:corrinoid protein [Deltaproteobacteria bacterium]